MTDQTSLFSALLAFQRSMSNIDKKKEANTGKFGYKYADIAAVIDSIREPLAANGLCYLQMLTHLDGKPALQTILAHTSGEHIEATVPLMGGPLLDDPQKFGGVTTYFRRYALLGILGLATEDDDAQHASQSPASARPATQSMPPNKPPQLHTINTGGASQRVDEEMTWTEVYALTRPLGFVNQQAIEALIGQSMTGMQPAQVYDAFNRAYRDGGGTGELTQSTAPRRQVQWPLTDKQLSTIRSVLPKKGMDLKAWPGWMMYTLDTEEVIAPEDLSKTEASRIIDALFAMPDNKELQAAIEASGGMMAHGR